MSEAVNARALLGASPYKACVWFFGNSPYAPFDEDLLGPLAKLGCGFFRYVLPVGFKGNSSNYNSAEEELATMKPTSNG